jgi:hypothetical protein
MSTPLSFLNRKSSRQKASPPTSGNADIILDAQREILRQARRSFNLHEIGISTSIMLGIVAGGLVIADRIPEAGATAITGAGFLTYSAQANKEAQEKLGDLLESLKETAKH